MEPDDIDDDLDDDSSYLIEKTGNASDRALDNLERLKIDKKREKNIDQTKKISAFESVFDERTVFQLNKLIVSGIINQIEGIISAGKEANVYLGFDEEEKEIAIKIYKIDRNSSKWMRNYIIGDPRFKKIPSNISKIIFLWASKEFKNLSRGYKSGLSVPKPIYVKNNILIMEYIGFGTIPAPKLKDIRNLRNIPEVLNKILDFIKLLFQKARLVHGDLSEFNILYHNQSPVVIDMSQAVSIEHPKSEQYLVRDIKNIFNFFSEFNVILPNPLDFYHEIVDFL